MPRRWSDVPERAREDLLNWFNVTKPDAADRRRLAALYFAGRFHAWDCIACGDRCYYGDPDDWSHFQGVDQLDFISYPGKPSDGDRGKKCDHCRCHGYAREADPALTGIGEPSIWGDD